MQNHDDSSNLPVPFKAAQGTVLSTPAQTTLLAAQHDDPSRDGVVAYWRMVQRHKWLVVLVALLGATVGLLVTLPQTPVYQSQISVEVQGLNENFMNLQSLNPTSAPGGYVDPSYEIQTQVKVLQSRSLVERAVDRLLNDKARQYAGSTDRLAVLRKVFHMAPKPTVDHDNAIRAAAGGVRVKASETTRIIDISVDSTNPQLAADFANTLVDEFIQKSLDDRLKTTERTGEWLTKQLDDLKIKLERSEDALQSYASAVGLQFTGSASDKDGQQNVVDASVKLLQEQLLKARADRMVAQSKFELLSSSPPEALPQVLDDESLREYETKIIDLKRQRAELSPALKPANPKMEKLDAQIVLLQSALETARQKVVTRLQNEYMAARSHEQLLDNEFEKQLQTVSSQSANQVHYNLLKREVDTNRQLYETMLSKVKESDIASAMRASNFRIVDAAVPAGGPYKPNPINNSLLGLMAGIFFGVVLVLLKEQSDRSIQQPGDSALYLGISELGVIPSDRPVLLRRGQKPGTLIPTVHGNSSNDDNPVELVTWQRQGSLIAESFRTVLTSIMFSEQRPRVLVISSANPGEGKTTVSSNLSIALSEISQRVLLIDADMRRPRLHRLFNMKNDQGLSELLREKRAIKTADVLGAVRETWIPGLHVLTSGPWAANASTLLYSARLPEILAAVRQNFDTVVIDSPPMLHIADARLLAKHSDAVLLILRAGKTTRAAGLMAIQKFVSDGSTLMGTILTDWNPDQNGYSYDYKYYSSHAAYYTDGAVTNDLKAVNAGEE